MNPEKSERGKVRGNKGKIGHLPEIDGTSVHGNVDVDALLEFVRSTEADTKKGAIGHRPRMRTRDGTAASHRPHTSARRRGSW